MVVYPASASWPVSTVIAVLALAFSFGTTFVSYRRTKAQDIQNARQELRTILQRLSAIPRENLEAAKKYAGDQASILAFSQLFGQENTLLSRQAAEIAKKLPPAMVSATEYAEIAMTLQNAYNLNGAKEFFQLALSNARDFNDEINAIRSLASLDFLTGAPEAGRTQYKQALDIFAKYPAYDPYTKANTHVLTHLFWSQAEANMGQFPEAMEHIADARQLLAALPFSPGAEALKRQVADQEQIYLQGSSKMAAGPAAGPAPAFATLPSQ